MLMHMFQRRWGRETFVWAAYFLLLDKGKVMLDQDCAACSGLFLRAVSASHGLGAGSSIAKPVLAWGQT
jgi:hypothetical protein